MQSKETARETTDVQELIKELEAGRRARIFNTLEKIYDVYNVQQNRCLKIVKFVYDNGSITDKRYIEDVTYAFEHDGDSRYRSYKRLYVWIVVPYVKKRRADKKISDMIKEKN